MRTGDDGTPQDDASTTAGLFLYVGAIISMAVWLSMISDTPRGGVAALAGMVTISLFSAGLFCFTLGRPASQQTREAHRHDRPSAALVPRQ